VGSTVSLTVMRAHRRDEPALLERLEGTGLGTSQTECLLLAGSSRRLICIAVDKFGELQ